jgi:hypothetical protein
MNHPHRGWHLVSSRVAFRFTVGSASGLRGRASFFSLFFPTLSLCLVFILFFFSRLSVFSAFRGILLMGCAVIACAVWDVQRALSFFPARSFALHAAHQHPMCRTTRILLQSCVYPTRRARGGSRFAFKLRAAVFALRGSSQPFPTRTRLFLCFCFYIICSVSIVFKFSFLVLRVSRLRRLF